MLFWVSSSLIAKPRIDYTMRYLRLPLIFAFLLPALLFATDYRGTLSVENWNPVQGKNGPEVANITLKWNLSDQGGKPSAKFYLQWYLGLNYQFEDSLYAMRNLGEVKDLISIRNLVMEADVVSGSQRLGRIQFDMGATPPHGGLWGNEVTYQFTWRNFISRDFSTIEERDAWESRLREAFLDGVSLSKLRIYRLDFGGLQFVEEEIRYKAQQTLIAEMEQTADKAYASGDYLKAIELYQLTLDANPQALGIREKIALSSYFNNMEQGDASLAKKDYEAALKSYQAAEALGVPENLHKTKMELVQKQITQRNQTQQLWQQLQDQYNEKATLAAEYAEDAFNKAVLAESAELETCYLENRNFHTCEENYFNKKKAKSEAEARYQVYGDPKDFAAFQIERTCAKPACSLTTGFVSDSIKTASYHLDVAKRKFLRYEEFNNNEAFLQAGKEQLSLAMTLDSTLAEAHLLKAYLATDVIEQLAAVEKALSIDPKFKEALEEKQSLQGEFTKELSQKIKAGDVSYVARAQESNLIKEDLKVEEKSPAAFALEHDQAEVLAAILTNDLSPKSVDNTAFQSLLEMAAAENKHRSATYLLTQGADPAQLGSSGKNALIIATEKESMEVLNLFLKERPQLDVKEALLLSVEKGKLGLVNTFLVNESSLNVSDALGDNMLMMAIRLEHTHLIDDLLAKGVDVNHANNEGMTAIAYAAEKKSANIIQKLLNYQAELAPALQTLNSRDAEAVQFLCEQGLVFKMAKNKEEEVDMLVRYHPQIALAKHPIGLPFIFHALSLKQENIAFSLLAKDNTYSEPIEGKYLLLEAIKSGADSLVEELVLQRNTPVNIQDKEESSPLHLAVHHDNRKVTVLLLSERHPLNAIDRNGRTPLHIALLEGRKDLASMLIGNGADLSLKDNKDWQPVHMAAYANDLNHLGLLIERGADVNARGESGMTPLHYAAQNADLPMIEYLLAAGADKTIEDYFGRTPYKIVKKARQRELAKWLK